MSGHGVLRAHRRVSVCARFCVHVYLCAGMWERLTGRRHLQIWVQDHARLKLRHYELSEWFTGRLTDWPRDPTGSVGSQWESRRTAPVTVMHHQNEGIHLALPLSAASLKMKWMPFSIFIVSVTETQFTFKDWCYLMGWLLLFCASLQGVGKNKIVDRFLHLLNRPREYIQLHRWAESS